MLMSFDSQQMCRKYVWNVLNSLDTEKVIHTKLKLIYLYAYNVYIYEYNVYI